MPSVGSVVTVPLSLHHALVFVSFELIIGQAIECSDYTRSVLSIRPHLNYCLAREMCKRDNLGMELLTRKISRNTSSQLYLIWLISIDD